MYRQRRMWDMKDSGGGERGDVEMYWFWIHVCVVSTWGKRLVPLAPEGGPWKTPQASTQVSYSKTYRIIRSSSDWIWAEETEETPHDIGPGQVFSHVYIIEAVARQYRRFF